MMGKKDLKIDFEVQKLLTLLMKSENASIDQFLQYDGINQRRIYRNILMAIKISIEINDEVSFKELSNILALLSDVNIFPNLISCFHFDENPFKLTNVVIVACRHNRLEILNQIFRDDSSIISDLSTKVDGTFPLPDDNDEESHNAFYYAVRSGNTKLLEVLMKKWPLDYFLSHAEELCFLLSKSMNELLLKNVDVSTEMKIYIHSFLLDNYFEQVIPSDSTDYSHDDIQESLSVILEYNDLYQTMYKTSESKIMQVFLAKQIVLKIMTLKKWLKSTYDRIPWEEMEFHLISFIRYLNNQGSYINCFVTENDFVKYLNNFCECLDYETKEINKIDKEGLSKLPEKLKRYDVVTSILSKYPHFEEFYKNYEVIRDYESLNIIKKYVDVVTEVNSLENSGKTVIIRVLQVLGENFKNTLESPKLSLATNNFLMVFIPNKTNTILKFLRDSFSHGFPLSTCKDIEERYGSEFYTFVQNDVKSLSYAVTSVLQKLKFQTMRTLLERTCNCKDIAEYKDISRMIRLVYFENDITDILPSNDNTVITVLEKLIADLSEIIKVKTHFEESIFSEIADIITFEKSALNKSKLELEFYLNMLYSVSNPSSILNNYTISKRKKNIKHMLNGIKSVMVPESLTRIGYLTNEIFKHFLHNEDEQGISNIYSTVLKIFYITECQGDEIKHLQEFKKNFTKTKKITTVNIRKIKNSSLTSYQDILSNDITSLRKIVREHNLSEFNTESFFTYKNDFKMQVEIEMLILSILSSLEYSNLFLITTQLSNEEGPLLVGRYLRNYLAHGNPIMDVLMDSTQSIFLFALKIIKHDIYREGNIKRIKNLSNAKSIVENQERLFCALSNGSLVDVKHWMKKGADIYGRDPDMRTALHYASKSPNINIIKFLIDRELNPKTKDVNDMNILHIATASGCNDVVSYIIEDLEISVDEKFKYNQTALHIAAENGFFDVVEILLHHKATINIGQFHETPLYKAVINDKAKTADLLLQNVQDINSIRHATGKTLLHVAADLGHKNMVEYLLSKGADVNSVSDTLVTPLHESAYAGHVEIVTVLISNGAIVNAKDSADNIPLHFAAFNGQSATAEILLKHGADFNALNKEKLSPLHRAILNGHLNVLKSFIEHGAIIEDEVKRRSLPVFEYAIRHNNLEVINNLIENGMSINIRDPDGCTPLHQSIKNGLVDMSLRCIECGADINSVDKFNLTPLSLCIKLGYFEIADKLLSKQANIHTVDYKGQTLLHMCVLNFKILDSMGEEYFTETYNDLISNPSRLNIFTKLVESGISIESKNIFGRTPLHLACIAGYDDIVQYLIPKLVDINTSDKMGYTPLHHAVKNNHLKVINILLASKKCCLNFRTFKNETALCLAVTNNYTESTRLLIKYGADVNDGDPLYKALMRGNQDMCIILLENKSTNIEKQFKDKSQTLLWYAVNKGLKRVLSCVLDKKKLSTSDDLNETLYFAIQGDYDDIVTILLNHGADVNFVFKPNFSPLHLAVSLGHSDIIKLLLARGADFNKLNSDNQRPVDLAVFLGHLESAQIFFQKQIIDINEKINGDSTLLNLAAECGHLDIVKFLINEGSDLNVIGSSGSKPIHRAAQMGHLHIVKYFIQCDEKLLTDRGSANKTLLHYAASGGQTEVVKYLIQKGIDVNDECDNRFRPIDFAIMSDHAEVIKLLLNYGSFYDCIRLYQIEEKDIKGIFLMIKELFHSVICNNIPKVVSLVDEGACINAKDSTNNTVLHYAAREGHTEITQILVKSNSNPNIFAEKNATPLHYASVHGRIEVVIILLKNGAIYDAITTDKKTPLDLSSSASVSDLLKLIDSAFKSVKNANIEILNTLAKITNSDVLKSIMCTKNKKGKTLLSCAIDNDFPQINHLQQLFYNYSEAYNQIYNHLFIKKIFNDHISKQTNSLQKISHTHVLDNPDSLETKENSAILLYKQEKYQEALDIFQEMLQKKIEIFGLGNIRTQKTRFYIGSILHRLDRNEEAIEILEDVYLQQNILLGLDHFETLMTLCSMTEVLKELKRYDDALNQNSIMLEKFQEMFGLENPLTIHSLELRANILTDTDKYGEALSCCKCVYEYKKRELGPSHPDTLMSLFKVKSLLYYQSSSDKALNDLQDFLKIQENVLGPNHRFMVIAEYELAKLLFKCHKFSEGFKMTKRYVAKLKAISGENDSKVLKMEQNLEKMKDGVDIFNLLASKYKAPKPSASLMQDMYQFETFDSEGTTFLHFAAREGHTSLVNYALRIGFNVMVVTNTGNTALHIAASEGHTEIIELLLMHVKETNFKELTAFINARTRNSRNSALHAAADVETVKTLLSYGAIYNIRNKDGKTPKDFTTVDSISDFLQLIEEFFIGALIGDGKITSKFKKLYPKDKLAVLNARNELHHTILQVVENYGYKEIIETIELQLQLEIYLSNYFK